MGEYEDRYPDAYGRDEVIEQRREKGSSGIGLPRETSAEIVTAAGSPRPAPQPVTARNPGAPTPAEIRDTAMQELAASPFIDAAGIEVTVDAEGLVRLTGAINSLIAIALAKALVSNIAGVRRVETQLRVEPPRHSYDAPVAATR